MKRSISLLGLCALVISLGAWRSIYLEPVSVAVAPAATTTLKPMSLLEAMAFIEQETGAMFSITTKEWLDCNDNLYEMPLSRNNKPSCGDCVSGTTHEGQAVLIPAGWEVNAGGTCSGEDDIKDPVPCVFECTDISCGPTVYGSTAIYCAAVAADPYHYMHW